MNSDTFIYQHITFFVALKKGLPQTFEHVLYFHIELTFSITVYMRGSCSYDTVLDEESRAIGMIMKLHELRISVCVVALKSEINTTKLEPKYISV